MSPATILGRGNHGIGDGDKVFVEFLEEGTRARARQNHFHHLRRD